MRLSRWLLVGIMSLAAVPSAFAQGDRARAWLAELESGEQARVSLVRRDVAEWMALSPGRAIALPPAPAGTWSDEQRRTEIALLRATIASLLKEDPSRPFYLGMTSVTVTAPNLVLSPIADHIDQSEIRKQHALTVDQAIEYLPGVSIDHKAPRNQTGVSIGGFDGRQVPLYLDGLPAYLPYDGYVDLARYLTSDVGQIQVAKGHSSPLLGPNVMGGVVNVVTRQPQKGVEGEVSIGTGPGGLVNAAAQLGTRRKAWFAQGAADRLQSDFYPISDDFAPNPRQPGGRRSNSSQEDSRYRVRAGWTPTPTRSYVLSYVSQRGTTDVPPYSGTAPSCPTGGAATTAPCVTPKFWRWPKWDADTVYLNARTDTGSAGALSLRAFYSRYANTMAMFDDASYSSMNVNASSGTLENHDRSAGASGQFDARRLKGHAFAASFFVKIDTHAEQTTTFSKANVATTTPEQTARDRQSSFGVQDTIAISPRLTATIGMSADRLRGLEAQDLSADRTHTVPFPVAGSWAYNPVGSLAYAAGAGGTAFVTYAHKSRFPTLKDRYSYKAGRALPNPTLKPEHADTWTAGYSRAFRATTMAQVDVFRSLVTDAIETIFFLSPLCSGGGRGAPGSCQQAANVGSEARAGVNGTLRSTAIPHLTVDANYGYLHRTMSGTGTFPTGAPVHKAMATATVRLAHGATALVTLRYQSGAVGMSDNGLPLPGNAFSTVDLGATLPLGAGLRLQAGAKNVFDANYYYWEGFPEAGRNAHVMLRYGF